MMSGGTFLEGGRPAANGPGVYSLKWNSFQSHITKGLSKLLDDNSYTDVTLACEGCFLKAHKLLLSLCSPFFKRLFEANDLGKSSKSTIVILNNVRFKDLENIIRFIYNGQANVNQADLHNFLETGELLQIEGLASCSTNQGNQNQNEGNRNSPSFGSSNTTVTTASTLPPLPTLQSYPPRVVASSTTPSNMNSAITNSTMMDSRLRATLTNTGPMNSHLHSHSQSPNSMQMQPKPASQTQQQFSPPKRPRLLNMSQELPPSSSPVSRLQSILTGQIYTTPSGVNPKPVQMQNSVRTSPAPVVIVERDPLEQDDDVIHIDGEPDNIECEPMIAISSVKSMAPAQSIQVYSLDDDGDGKQNENIGEDEFDESQEMVDRESDTQGLYRENMDQAGRNKGGPSTSQGGVGQNQGTGSAAGIRSTSIETRQASSSSSSPIFNAVSPNPMFQASLALRDLASSYAASTNSNFTEDTPTSNQAPSGHMSACEVCNLLIEATEMEDHLYKTHGRGSALCPICHRFFKNKNSLKVHKSMYHRKPRDSTENETSSFFQILPPTTEDLEFGGSTNSLPELSFQEEKYSHLLNKQETD